MDEIESLIKKHTAESVDDERVPAQAVRKAKDLMRGGTASCPHCGKAITPLKKPYSQQTLWNWVWLVSAALAFGLSFVFPRYFYQFLVLTIIFAFKWAVEHRATKTQVLIYKALKEEEGVSRLKDLHGSSSRL